MGTLVAGLSSALLLCFSRQVVEFFNPETAETLRIGSRMLIFMGFALPTLGYSTYVNQLYQSLGFVQGATVLASCRQGIFFVPLIFALPAMLGLDGILLAQPVSDVLTCVISIPFNVHFLKKVLGNSDAKA